MLGTFNVSLGLIISFLIGYYDSIFEISVVLILAPFIFVLNRRSGYVPALYLFSFIGCFFFFFLSAKLGPESFAFLYYFPFTFCVVQMSARKEIYRHMAWLVVMCLVSVVAALLSYRFDLFAVRVEPELLQTIKYINIFFSFVIAIVFVFIISTQAIAQEQELKNALQQKEVLLAELFHRVKNNLNIITSLLNLKKNSIDSKEAKDALEECRNLVFSMALVHTKIYNTNSIDKLNFSEYLEDLVPELINSIGGLDKVDFEMNSSSLSLSLIQAIPCALIVNELITNAFKHGRVPDKKLKIVITLTGENNRIGIEVKDNGPGKEEAKLNKNTLGMDLIKSLVEQLDGEYSFINQEGLRFNLQFNQ